MKAHFLLFILCICSVQTFYSQEDDGVVSLAIPTRNSLTFNRYTINPTFSFVREQTKYISIYNKREWIQFENAPLTYLASYSGRFGENIGAGLGLFQQNYGVLTTFGGILNFAYNARLGQDSNLTFGINVGAYKSGVNTANVVTNFEDPSLQNVPENFLLTINPGINYGTEFLDFGLSINNLALYNFESSELIEDNPQQGIQAHIMYTGYMDSRGFFDESKFSGLLRSEFQKEETILSAVAMVTVPKGIWAQAGYNTLNGVSGGVGLNITTQIAIEYNYEKAIGDLNTFGSSHEITLAYRFKNNNYYDYSREDEVSGILSGRKKKRRISKTNNSRVASRKTTSKTTTKTESDAQAKLIAEQKAKAKAEEEQKAKELVEIQAELDKIEADKKAEQEAQAKLLAEQKAQEEADEQAKDDAISNPTDTLAKSMQTIAKSTENSKAIQNELLKQFDDIVAIKDQDLKDLKEENDLSDQGITVKPKPFKSVTAENNALNAIKSDLENVIQTRSEKIDALNKLYEERVENGAFALDEVTLFYKKEIKRLKAEQLKAKEVKTKLDTKLEAIRVATEFEKRRRIKRAAFNNEEDRYSQDRAMLKNIKETTKLSDTPLKAEDFDFGEDLGNSIKILKNIDNVESGYYLIIAVHSDTKQRNEFVTNVVASGRSDVDFFHDVSTSKYYIFYDKFDNISDANEALKTKGNRPYNGKMSIVKIEN